MRKILLYIGGSLTLLFALLHVSFWKLGNWQEELVKLTPDNKGIMQMLNVGSLYMLLCGALLTFHLAKKKELAVIEKACLLFLAGYYILRIVFGIPFFGFSLEEVVIWIVCCAVASCYLFALRHA